MNNFIGSSKQSWVVGVVPHFIDEPGEVTSVSKDDKVTQLLAELELRPDLLSQVQWFSLMGV